MKLEDVYREIRDYFLKANQSVYIASRTYDFLLTVCNSSSMKKVIKCVKSYKGNGNCITWLSTVL